MQARGWRHEPSRRSRSAVVSRSSATSSGMSLDIVLRSSADNEIPRSRESARTDPIRRRTSIQAHLPHDVAGGKRRDPLAVPKDLRVALLDHLQLVGH